MNGMQSHLHAPTHTSIYLDLPVNEWHVITLAHTHTHQYLFRRAIVAHANNCMPTLQHGC